jgi:hypothetical protein
MSATTAAFLGSGHCADADLVEWWDADVSVWESPGRSKSNADRRSIISREIAERKAASRSVCFDLIWVGTVGAAHSHARSRADSCPCRSRRALTFSLPGSIFVRPHSTTRTKQFTRCVIARISTTGASGGRCRMTKFYFHGNSKPAAAKTRRPARREPSALRFFQGPPRGPKGKPRGAFSQAGSQGSGRIPTRGSRPKAHRGNTDLGAQT